MNSGGRPIFGVGEFVAYVNQTLETAYPYLYIEGELANFKVSKNRWVYFDLKDESASVRCFAVVTALPGPLEDGMVVRVAGSPRLHQLYGFTFNVQVISPVGEGFLRRAADMLAAKLEREGLFDPARKRPLPATPRRIALITAGDSAAYADFIKITTARWGGLAIDHYDVFVQGERAAPQIIEAIGRANEAAQVPEVIVLIRGGGSADDLAVFSDERVVRAVAGSRVPTLVAIGHEVDISLAELAADRRASTPSNAAELLVPDRHEEQRHLWAYRRRLDEQLAQGIMRQRTGLVMLTEQLDQALRVAARRSRAQFTAARQLFTAYDPARPLAQGYAIVRTKSGALVHRVGALRVGETIAAQLNDGIVTSRITQVKSGTQERTSHE